MNIALIGFMGVGKTTVSHALSKHLGAEEIDIDRWIGEQEGRRIPEIFETDGEKAFRDLETAAVKTLGNQDGRILSCGGGAVLRPENVEALKKNGVIVLLTAEPETVYGRVKNGQDRPVLKGRMSVEGISELMEKRRPVYESAASFSVATDGRTPREIAEEIAQKAEWVCGKDNLWNTD